jgi:fructokinase
MRIGIDFGGTKIEAIALDDDGTILARERKPTPRDDYPGTVNLIRDLALDLERFVGHTGTVGVGMPGAISPATGLVKNTNSTWSAGKPFDADLSAALDREVRVANDANCFAVSEAVDGAAAGGRVVFGVILGTGVGGGIAINGVPITGRHAIGGEWGHNPLPWPRDEERPGRRCYCGKDGCIETFCCGPGFAADFELHTGEYVAPQAIIERLRTNDPAAKSAWARYTDRLSRALAAVINVLDPDAIVLGGGMSNVTEIYSDLPERLSHYVFSDVCDTPILQALHGDSSGVRGAAWLW